MQDNIISIKFSDSVIPDFKESRGVDHIKFGEKDDYPDYLLELYDKSAKHGAIINNKCKYILGKGLECESQDPKAIEFKTAFAKLAPLITKDIEIFGGFYLEIIPTMWEGIFSMYHVDFRRIRTNSDGSMFYYKKNWKKGWNEDKITYPAFNRTLKCKSIFQYKEYRPGGRVYALPGYVASCNYIEADIEVSKHTLTNAQTGFSGSKFINFYNGEPTPEAKQEIEKRFKNKFGGSQGDKIVIGFNNDVTKKPTIEDLGTSDLTKEDFSQVDNLITNNIFAGAEITHPLLFGIQQEGKLGGSTELRTAFDIFKNTYVNAKQQNTESIAQFFAGLKGISDEFKIKDIDPIGVEITTELIRESLSKEEIRERLGYVADQEVNANTAVTRAINSLSPLVANKVLESMTVDEIRSLAGLMPKVGGDQVPGLDPALAPKTPEQLANENPVNDNIKNLSAKQHQQLVRIIRQFGKGQITRETATILLKTGLGLNAEDISGILGDDQQQAFSSDDDISLLFEVHGELKESYDCIKSREATFINEDDEFLQSLTFDDDFRPTQTELIPPVKPVTPPPVKTKFPKFMIRYSYEVRPGEGAAVLPTTRPFCERMIGLNKFYSREDIQKISGILGYDVFGRVGGFWNDNGVTKKHCRHEWRANIVVKK